MSNNRPHGAAPQGSLLTTKLFIPPARADLVLRPRLTNRLNEGLKRKLTLISAPAGFGKTTLLGEWIPASPRRVTWISLNKSDNDPIRFWNYVIAALQMLQSSLGKNTQALLDSPQPPSSETTLTSLVNEITAFPDTFALVLDDYHVIEAQPIHQALSFLLEHQLESATKYRNALMIRQMKALHAQLSLWEHDLAAAARWAEESNLINDHDFTFARETEYLTLVRVLLAQTRYDEAIALLERYSTRLRPTEGCDVCWKS